METAATATAPRRALQVLLLVAIAGALFMVARANYLLFHSLVEIFSITVALSVFVIAWTGRRYLENAYLLIVGVSYLFVGLIDVIHVLAYSGMSVFTGPVRGSQLWIAARALEAATLLAAFAWLPVRRRPHRYALIAVYGTVTAMLLASIFRWDVFPACFVEGIGQTPFKIAAEWAIIGALGVAVAILAANRARFERGVWRAISLSILFAIAGEFCFTLYSSPVGLSNMTGHYFKLFSAVAIYVALVETCVERPFDLVFRELNLTNTRLMDEIAARVEVERAKDRAILELQSATAEIDQLRGIIPICSHCKKIRDDRGAWRQVEAYIQAHSGALFSHGICPDCVDRYYPISEEDQAG